MFPLATSRHLHSRHSLDINVFEQWRLLFLRLMVAVLYSDARTNDHDGISSSQPRPCLAKASPVIWRRPWGVRFT